jgi:hypothetical protein
MKALSQETGWSFFRARRTGRRKRKKRKFSRKFGDGKNFKNFLGQTHKDYVS